MKNVIPKRLIFFVSIIISLLALVVSLFLPQHFSGIPLYLLLWVMLFLISFSLTYFAVETFIHSKIKVIYKTIYDLRKSDDASRTKIDMGKDVIGKINQEVLTYVQTNKEELEELKRLEVFRREFLGNVSHELKTPIFSIQGYIHTLLDGGLEDEHINVLYLEKAARGIERLCTIVDDLEAISRLEAGDLILEIRGFDIHELTKDIFDSLEIKAKERNITLSFKEDCDRSFYVEADKERIRQVMINLIVNSIKYGKYGGHTSVGFFNMHENILIEVSDDGIGVDEKHLSRLFERFYRVDKSRSREQGGTGLGLSIVKHILEAHRQIINVKSSVGFGTTFWFTLKKS